MSEPVPNQMFAQRYLLEAVLGEGGFATVYRARDVGADRIVAIKVLKQENGQYSPDIESRFAREVRVIAQLRDPHTVTLHDHGRTQDGQLFMVFEYLPGRDLSQVLSDERQLAPSVVVHILLQVLRSLAEAHSKGLLHRDIKPENIRVYEYMGDPYHVKMIDFGIARPFAAVPGGGITKAGELVGTPRYMSPEQLVEEELTPASDLYSLGLVAFELLAGSAALQGPRWSDQFDRLVTGHVFGIEEYERIGPGLQTILRRMTARHAQDRFPTAESVITALEGLLRGDSQDRPFSRPVTAVRRRPIVEVTSPAIELHGVTRRRTVAIAVGIVVLLILGGLLVKHRVDERESEREAWRRLQLNQRTGSAVALQKSHSRPAAVVATSDAGALAPDLSDGELPDGGSSGCGRRRLRIDDPLSRRGALHIPANYNPRHKYPLVLLFHQDTRDGAQILEQTGFGPVADREGFIVFAPNYEGETKVWAWREPKDVQDVSDLFEDVAQTYCIDEAKVFAVGHGSGGHVVERLSCEPWVAAVATNGFRSDVTGFEFCRKSGPIPSLHIGMLHSKRMLVDGGASCFVFGERIPLKQNETKWLTRNSCAAQRKQVIKEENGRCWEHSCEAPFVVCHIDGGYGWPGSPKEEFDLGGCEDVVKDFPTTETIWGFFAGLSG